MELDYYLMRKNDPITLLTINELGHILYTAPKIKNEEQAPLEYRSQQGWLQKWWENRSIPVTRDHIQDHLRRQGCSLPSEYLVKNLGLSLTDYYWIKPVDSSLTWEKVNLFDNDFRDNTLFEQPPDMEEETVDASAAVSQEKALSSETDPTAERIPHYSPNGSLQGDIEKTWLIMNGERWIVKGNRNEYSYESINEVIASEIHRRQGYDNYAQYYLIEIGGKPYDYGCCAKAFTSQKLELVSAWAVYSSRKQPNDLSAYEHFIRECGALGMDTDQLRRDLEYQIMTDFIVSEYDRHLNNLGILRDADSLKPVRMAPIFDSGGMLFVNREKPRTWKDLLKMKTNGFAAKEMTLVNAVRDKNVIDLTKLPPASFLREQYEKDSKADSRTIRRILDCYEQKIEMCRLLQLGRNPMKEIYS